jgi:GDP-4-dehydro-6-deoxy-D-mannose reductase
LITGIAGFAGSHLAEHLLTETDWDVWGTTHHNQHNIDHLHDQLTLHCIDLRDPNAVRDLICEARPDRIYHLAGQSYVPASWRDPWGTFELNVRSQINLLEAILTVGLTPGVLIVSSNEVYGLIRPTDLPIDEDTPLRPASPYAVSKVAQDMQGLQYHLNYGLNIVRVRPFNHIGPRQRAEFVASAFARQVVEIEASLRPPVVHVGNLGAERDFTDVRDMVRGYFLALERGKAGAVYNIGAGQIYSVRQLLETLLELSTVQVTVEHDPTRVRPSDVPVVICNATRFRTQTGWAPRISFRESLHSVLEYWRSRVERS